ncbi:hypothetical protein B194_0869 [Serratia plymuthica A30]|nr:hypothetical protein B194_0869 [Serratia plymuthica A30]
MDIRAFENAAQQGRRYVFFYFQCDIKNSVTRCAGHICYSPAECS